jgi:hypothetical protein
MLTYAIRNSYFSTSVIYIVFTLDYALFSCRGWQRILFNDYFGMMCQKNCITSLVTRIYVSITVVM